MDMKKEPFRSETRNTDALVDSVLDSYRDYPVSTRLEGKNILNRGLIIEVLEKLRQVLFPGYYDESKIRPEYVRYIVGEHIEFIQYHLTKQVAVALGTQELCEDCERSVLSAKAEQIVDDFLAQIPKLREYLASDIEAAFNGDPAAYSTDEIILSYPGVSAITTYRIAHELWIREVPLIPRIMSEYAHSVTGVDIHPGATIGKYFFIDHATGIVIGETTEIGENVKIYQGVTLGALSTRKGQQLRGVKRHPTLGNNVTIYANTTVLGGETVIGDGATIAGNTFIVDSVSANMKVSARAPELEYSRGKGGHTPDDDIWDFVI